MGGNGKERDEGCGVCLGANAGANGEEWKY
jgi:hypothetical protein